MKFGLVDRLRRSRYAFPLAVSMAVAMLFVSEGSYRQSTEAMREVQALNADRVRMHQLLLKLVDIETGQRGYLLTGRSEYLEPYRNGIEDVMATLAQVEERYRSNPGAAPELAEMRRRIESKLSEVTTTLGLYEEGRHDAWRELLLSNIGKDSMDAIRTAGEQMLAQEAQRVVQARARVFDSLLLNRIGVAAVTLLALAAIFILLRQNRVIERQRRDQQRAVQAERDRLEAQVVQRTAQLVELARHLQSAREDERQRLARELHDELGALLTTAKLDVARIKARSSTPEVVVRLQHLSETLNSGIALKRRIIEDLRPSSLANLGLVAALDILLRDHSERSGVKIESRLEEVSLTPESELTVYRLVQEALTNIAKYARARRIEVELASRGDRAEVSVRDDGVGFDTQAPTVASHGLMGMRYRVESEGGQFTLDSTPGRGTRVAAALPQLQAGRNPSIDR